MSTRRGGESSPELKVLVSKPGNVFFVEYHGGVSDGLSVMYFFFFFVVLIFFSIVFSLLFFFSYFQLSFPAMQVTSSHVSSWFDLPAS